MIIWLTNKNTTTATSTSTATATGILLIFDLHYTLISTCFM